MNSELELMQDKDDKVKMIETVERTQRLHDWRRKRSAVALRVF